MRANMASPNDVILYHAPDGLQWAKFISGRLTSPKYHIACTLKDITATPPLAAATTTLHSPTTTTTTTTDRKPDSETDDHDSSDLYVNRDTPTTKSLSVNDKNNNHRTSGENIDSADSGKGCSNNSSSFDTNSSSSLSSLSTPSLTHGKANVVFLTPEVLERCPPSSVDMTSLPPRQSVFLFLGVDIEEGMRVFGDQSDRISKCRCCVVDGSDLSILDAMKQIIEAYESEVGEEDVVDEDFYQTLPSSIQKNSVQKVFPRELTEEDRDVYILLERPAEDDVTVVLVSAMSQEIQLTCVCGSLYTFTLPPDVTGQISFVVECREKTYGTYTVQAMTKLDRIKAILDLEVNPATVLTSAIGLDPDDLGGLDTALAFRLQKLSSALTFKTLFPCEDALANDEERSDSTWPSLLHFAADLNLRTFCSELLRYPGMLAAACTENREGLYPHQIAANKGFSHLETDLIKFVEDHKQIQSQVSDSEVASPLSKCDSSVFGSQTSRDSRDEDEDEPCEYENIPELNLGASTGSWKSEFVSSPRASSHLLADKSSARSSCPSGLDSPGKTARKALKLLGVNQEDISRPESVVGFVETLSATHPPGTRALDTTFEVSAVPRGSLSSNCDDPVHLCSGEKTRGNLKTKVKSFWSKMKKGRSNSDGVLIFGPGTGIKKSPSSRSSDFKCSSGSNRSSSRSLQKPTSPNTIGDPQERDSGSYSDEEKKSSPVCKRNSKNKEFKESGKLMTRRTSKRVQYVMKEKVDDAPNLPSKSKKKGQFTVYT